MTLTSWLLAMTALLFVVSPAPAQPTAVIISLEPTVAQAQQRLDEARGAESLSETDAATLQDLLGKALESARGAEANLERIEELRRLADGLPRRIEEVRGQTAAAQPASQLPLEIVDDIDTLEARLRSARAEAERLDLRTKELDAELAGLATAPRTLREAYAEAERELTALRSAAPPPQGSIETDPIGAAREFARRAQLRLQEARTERLRLELSTVDERAELATALRERAQAEGRQAKARLEALQQQLARRRAEQAQQAREQAVQTEVAAIGKAEVVKTTAQRNSDYARALARVAEGQEQLLKERDRVEQVLATITQDYQNAESRLEVAGLSSTLGTLLREQRRALPDSARFARRAEQRQGRIAEVSVAQFQVDDALADLAALPQAVAARMLAAEAPAQGTPEYDAAVEELEALLTEQRELLGQLRSGYAAQLKALGELEFVEQRLSLKVRDYAAFLDERLLWIPNATAIDGGALPDLLRGLAWLIAPTRLTELVTALVDNLLARPILLLTVLVVVVLLFKLRAAGRAHLRSVGQKIGQVQEDRFGLTVEVLLISLALAAPMALLFAALGGQLLTAEQVGDFPHAVGRGLLVIAPPLYTLQIANQVFRPEGLGVLHFGWTEESCASMRRHVRVLAILLLPCLFLVGVMHSQPDEALKNSLGRLAFIGVMLALVVFMHQVFNPRRGVFFDYIARSPNSWMYRLRGVWWMIAVALPLGTLLLAGTGYYYTALRLGEHVGLTIRLLGVAILVYHLVMRALLVAERRLALRAALERRAARRAHDSDDQGEGGGVPLDIPRLDRETLNAQTRGLTRILVGWASVVALFLVWADVLPALSFLDGVSLWTSSDTSGGQIVDEDITLGDVVIALALAAVFTVAARNLPGVLEIALLSRLPLDAGLRYAISTLLQYIVVGAGVLVVFEAVGVGWGQAQWLVAALGVGLGFGLQEIFANFVSGIIILFERPVRIGDTVTLGELTGTVTRIRMRATTVTDWDRKEIVIPNKSFITERLINWTLTDPITRVTIPVGVAYGSDTKLVERLLHEAAESNERSLPEPHHQVFFMGFGESTLDFELRVFVDGLPNMMAVRHELHMSIDASFRENDVEIAFPQRDLHVRSVDPGAGLGLVGGRPVVDGPPSG